MQICIYRSGDNSLPMSSSFSLVETDKKYQTDFGVER